MEESGGRAERTRWGLRVAREWGRGRVADGGGHFGATGALREWG